MVYTNTHKIYTFAVNNVVFVILCICSTASLYCATKWPNFFTSSLGVWRIVCFFFFGRQRTAWVHVCAKSKEKGNVFFRPSWINLWPSHIWVNIRLGEHTYFSNIMEWKIEISQAESFCFMCFIWKIISKRFLDWKIIFDM